MRNIYKKCLTLNVQRGTLGRMNHEQIEAYIGEVKWKFAKTMPQFPHFYTVRWDRPDLDRTFLDFVVHIREHGYAEKFFRRTMIYYNVGEYKYWTMGSPLWDTYILNRARIENVYGHEKANK